MPPAPRLRRALLAGLLAALAAAGCLGGLGRAPEEPPPAAHVVASLAGGWTVEGPWSVAEVARAAEAIGFHPSVRERSLHGRQGADLSLSARLEPDGAWRIEARRDYWRVDVCSREELRAWHDASWESARPELLGTLARLARALGAPEPTDVEREAHARMSDGTVLRLPESCPGEDPARGVGVVRTGS